MLAALGFVLFLPFHYGYFIVPFLHFGTGSATAWTSDSGGNRARSPGGVPYPFYPRC